MTNIKEEESNIFPLPVETIAGREEAGWCGPACLAHVALHFGVEGWDEKTIGLTIGTSAENGTGYRQMLAGAELMGLKGEWVKKPLDELDRIRKEEEAQIILNWMSGPNEKDDGHYSNFEGFLRVGDEEIQHVTLNDPEWVGGLRLIPRPIFEEVWYDISFGGEVREGYALVIKQPMPDA